MECKFNIEDLTEEKLEELIETLWNVNESAPADWIEQLRINRNIVECKFFFQTCDDTRLLLN